MGETRNCPHLFNLSAPLPAETQAEALPTGTDFVLGLNVCEVSCILAVDAQHPVSYSHTSLCSFASRSELWGQMSRGPFTKCARAVQFTIPLPDLPSQSRHCWHIATFRLEPTLES